MGSNPAIRYMVQQGDFSNQEVSEIIELIQ